jgi:hypothetical protein
VTDGWDGRTYQRVRVIGETRTRYRVAMLGEPVKLAGRNRWLRRPEESALVPKYAVRFGAR